MTRTQPPDIDVLIRRHEPDDPCRAHRSPAPRAQPHTTVSAPGARRSETTNRDPIAEAERYALNHSKRAALISRLRRLQDKTDIGWVAPDIVQALVTGSRPILLGWTRSAGFIALPDVGCP